MALVDYSGSEESDEEHPKPSAAVPKTKAHPSKPNFQKLVDPSSPKKIQVVLPNTANGSSERLDESEPPAKRAKTGLSGLSGFNSFLPAPKRAGAPIGGQANGLKKGLGKGISLKTGAEPAFSRTAAADVVEDTKEVTVNSGTLEPSASSTVTSDNKEESQRQTEVSPETQSEAKVVTAGNTSTKKKPMFKPLSVARKPQKKNPATTNVAKASITKEGGKENEPQAQPTSRISLFSTASEDPKDSTIEPSSKGIYQPMLYQEHDPDPPAPSEATLVSDFPYENQDQTHTNPIYNTHSLTQPHLHDPNSLNSIANDLNLSASAKRQLFGRNGNASASSSTAAAAARPINVVNFNTDQEYAANEAMRQAGETVQHNPVRAIAPGKHSLKQLMSAATNQKEALEEHFATGKRNRSEAGSKYGW